MNGRLVLLLGAGASMTCEDRSGNKLLDGSGLAKLLATESGLPYHNETLPTVYSAVKKPLGARLNSILEQHFKHAKPSVAYNALAKYPWPRIYTLNIDDAVETAFRKLSSQHVNVRHRFDKIVDRSPFFEELDVVKLNGSIDRLDAGLIFSPQEYGAASARSPLWYEELARDFFRYTFLFVGTKLAEPLFYHQIERFRSTHGEVEGESYVITPTATEIQKGSLAEMNLQHIPGTLDSFMKWLRTEIPKPPRPIDVAKKVYPELNLLVKGSEGARYVELFENVIRVSRVDLAASHREKKGRFAVRDFYRGFKPSWREVLDGVPARLRVVDVAFKRVAQAAQNEKLFVIYGPAGSGKSTALHQIALELSDRTKRPVYFLASPVKNLREIIEAIEGASDGPYYFCIDRLASVADSVHEILSAARSPNLTIVATERQNVWLSRTVGMLGKMCSAAIELDIINKREALEILQKLETFGPWHRLSKLKEAQRVEEILNRSKRQLLIGLLEATNGQGFDQIILRDFKELPSSDARKFVITVGLATIHGLGMPDAILSRALGAAKVLTGIPHLLDSTAGIVKRSGSNIFARHAVYVERLFETVVSKHEKYDSIVSLLEGFSVYERPLMRSVGRAAGNIFKLTVNHRFLRNTLNDDAALVLSVYETFAKAFQDDGLFWLHFGLALRDYGRNPEALEKLKFARQTTRLRHAEHAYAQQLFIMAKDEDSKILIAAYLAEAKQILEVLDSDVEGYIGDETDYPIVTLSENHVEIVRKIDGENGAKEIAKYYANILAQRVKDNPSNIRLQSAWKGLAAFAVGSVSTN